MGKRKKKEVEDEAEMWIYSYADMMSLISCFFIIFFSISTKASEQASEVIKSILETFNRQNVDKVSSSDYGFEQKTNDIKALHLMLASFNLGDNSYDMVEKAVEIAKSEQDYEVAKKILEEELKSRESEESDVKKKKHASYVSFEYKGLFYKGRDKFVPERLRELKMIIPALKSIDGLAQINVSSQPSPRGGEGDVRAKAARISLAARRGAKVAAVLIQNGVSEKVIKVESSGQLTSIMGTSANMMPKIVKHRISERTEISIKMRLL